MALLLGCIADDFTGATDLSNNLVQNGMRTVQLIGRAGATAQIPDADAVVVALKSRTAPVKEAVADSLASLDWLCKAGTRQFFFKYCSTFDSTEEGNIGPVIEALLEALGADFTLACPAFPATGRTVYQGHLFVGDSLLSESSMRNHPLTPMRDANLVRFLGRQTRLAVGLVPFQDVEAGSLAIRRKFDQLRAEGKRIAIVDALTDAHLRAIGEACQDLALVTGGSGVAIGLPDNFRRAGLLKRPETADVIPEVSGFSAVISGSCSPATLGQVAVMEQECPTFRIKPIDLAEGRDGVLEALAWARQHLGSTPILITASAPPDEVEATQRRLGRMKAGELIEGVLAAIAEGLVDAGVRRLVVAGGETSGAVVSALNITGLRIGHEIDPGVPCTVTVDEPRLALALKSGNFGGPDFFLKALRVMP